MPCPPPSQEPDWHSWEQKHFTHSMGKSQSPQGWGFGELGMASKGDKFDKELMETVIILIKSLRLLGQMGEGQNPAS